MTPQQKTYGTIAGIIILIILVIVYRAKLSALFASPTTLATQTNPPAPTPPPAEEGTWFDNLFNFAHG